ncbi:replication protein, partial [Streptococcus pluranimalium]
KNKDLNFPRKIKAVIEKKKDVNDKGNKTLVITLEIGRYLTVDVEEKEDRLNEVCDLIDEYDIAKMR